MKLKQEMYEVALDANRYLEHVSRDGMITWERTYLRRLIEISAADGNYYCEVDAIWPRNIKWLRDEGFLVLGDDDKGYQVSWGRSI